MNSRALISVLFATLLSTMGCKEGDDILNVNIDCTNPGTICKPYCPSDYGWACTIGPKDKHPNWQPDWIPVPSPGGPNHPAKCWCIPPRDDEEEE